MIPWDGEEMHDNENEQCVNCTNLAEENGWCGPCWSRIVPPEETWADVARAVAAEFGRELTDDEVDYVLWEHTGFPSFWHGEPRAECIRQLREFFTTA